MRPRRYYRAPADRTGAPWTKSSRGYVHATTLVLALVFAVKVLQPGGAITAIAGAAMLAILVGLGVARGRQAPDVEATLRAVIGKTVYLGVSTDARAVGEVYGRVLAVDHGRVQVAVDSARFIFDTARVVENADTSGIRLGDVRWLRDGDKQITF